MSKKFYLSTPDGEKNFDTKEELKEYIKNGFNESGSWDWIGEIGDSEGNRYACDWDLKIVQM